MRVSPSAVSLAVLINRTRRISVVRPKTPSLGPASVHMPPLLKRGCGRPYRIECRLRPLRELRCAGSRVAHSRAFPFWADTAFPRILVRSEGLEPPRFYSLPPQGSASTNSATSAGIDTELAYGAGRGRHVTNQ